MRGWAPIETAPKDGTLIQGLDERTGYSFFRCFWRDGEWREMNFKGVEHPTVWRHNLPEHRPDSQKGEQIKTLAPRPWKVDRNYDGDHWKDSCSIFDAAGAEVCVLTRGYQGDANGGTPSWDNAELIVSAVNAYKPETL